jgi:hypothetical protein
MVRAVVVEVVVRVEGKGGIPMGNCKGGFWNPKKSKVVTVGTLAVIVVVKGTVVVVVLARDWILIRLQGSKVVMAKTKVSRG